VIADDVIHQSPIWLKALQRRIKAQLGGLLLISCPLTWVPGTINCLHVAGPALLAIDYVSEVHYKVDRFRLKCGHGCTELFEAIAIEPANSVWF
jgi:hypothetical protein